MAKRKLKSLPDLRQSHTLPESGSTAMPPTSGGVADLANRHGFPAGFDLEEKIEEAWEWWRMDFGVGPAPTRSDRLELLQGIADRANALKEALNRMGVLEIELIAASSAETLDLFYLRERCQELESAAIIATAKVPDGRVGKHGDPHSIELLCGLFRIWGDAFGADAPRISKAEVYGGRFFDFSKDVFRLFGIKKTDSGLGRAIEKAIAAVDRREAGRLSPKSPKKKR